MCSDLHSGSLLGPNGDFLVVGCGHEHNRQRLSGGYEVILDLSVVSSYSRRTGQTGGERESQGEERGRRESGQDRGKDKESCRRGKDRGKGRESGKSRWKEVVSCR